MDVCVLQNNPERQRRQNREQEYERVQPYRRIDRIKERSRQPTMSYPRYAGEREGEDFSMWHLPIREDVLSRLQVKPKVSVTDGTWGKQERVEQNVELKDPCEGSAREARLIQLMRLRF